MKALLTIIFLSLKVLGAFAQMPYSIWLNQTNGLPSNSVYDVMQDSKGFIWFATDAGLFRYDGHEYQAYYSNEQTSLSGSSIREDSKGRIWYENFDGYLYYVENDSLHSLSQNKPIAYIPISLTEKYLLILQKEGIDVYDIATLKHLKTLTLSNQFAVIEHCASSLQENFFILDGIIYKIDKDLKVKHTTYLQEKSKELKQIFFHQGKIYVLGRYNQQKKIWVFDTDLQFLETLPIPEITTSINYANFLKDELWIHTPKGTFCYTLVPNFRFFKVYFEDKSISAVLKDRQNNYWFSTTNQGVLLVADLEHLFLPLNAYLPYRITNIGKDFLIATKKGELILYDENFSIKKILKKLTDNTEIYYLHYDTLSGDIFFSSKGFTHLPQKEYKQKRFFEIAIKDMVRIDEKYYAFAASGYCGLISFGDNSSTSEWDKGDVYTKAMPSYSVIQMVGRSRGKGVAYNPEKNTIYFATNLGLFKVTPEKVQELIFDDNSFYASKLFFAHQTLYALSTKGNFYAIENETQLKNLNHLFEAGNNEIRIVKKFDSNLYILTNRGLFIWDLLRDKIKMIDVHINAYEVNDFTVSGDFIILLNGEGVTRISFLKKSPERVSPILQLRNFIVNDIPRRIQEKIYLKYNENNINIGVSVLDFGSARTNNLYYRLNKGAWKELSERNLNFEALQAGNYFLEFKLNEGITPQSINFIISAPFWKTGWFWAFVAFLVMTAGFFYYRLKIKDLRKQNFLLQEKIILEQQLNKSVLKSIKSQMNPHFFYNALNTIQAYIFTNDKMKANSYLAKFSKLTRLVLEQSEKETISIVEEIETLQLYLELEKMRFKDNFTYSIDTEALTHRDTIELPPMIIQPYVENAIKHGLLHKETDRSLEITFQEKVQEKELCVIIEDNGIGRKRSQELNQIKSEKHKSFATQANEKRLEILNRATTKKLGVEIIDKYEGDMPTGTKVILSIPF